MKLEMYTQITAPSGIYEQNEPRKMVFEGFIFRYRFQMPVMLQSRVIESLQCSPSFIITSMLAPWRTVPINEYST